MTSTAAIAPASDLAALAQIGRELRFELIALSHRAQSAHLGGALSCVDLLVALYWTHLRIDPQQPDSPKRDRLIFSKGHAVSALYAVLARRGFFPPDELLRYNEPGSRLPEQPMPHCVPGIEWATGSLGHGLGVGLGIALAGKIHKHDYRTCVLLGDGECQEGSIWEAALLAPALGLGQLTAIVDYNKWQATGRTDEVMAMPSLRAKWEAFGWTATEVDGHDLAAITDALQQPRPLNRPHAIIAHTVKGKGASFAEDDNNWHYRSPTADEVELARRELFPA